MGGGILAQNKQITGHVVTSDGSPVAGATVLIDGTSSGTTTNVKGQFTVSGPSDCVLAFSFIGYETQKVPVAGKTNLKVVLQESSEAISSVTVIGYGTGSKIGTTIGSVAKVKSDELEHRPTPNIADALQGKVAGLQIYTESGEPSAVSSIRLHGAGSLSASTDPLFILDGVPVSAAIFTSLNPNDIESVNMLKDASATSIYGSRAANGVIYIATKRGRRNMDAQVVANFQYGISQPASGKYEVMSTSEVAAYQLETGNIKQAEYNEIIESGINTNWHDYYYNSSAPTYQVDLSVSGGTEKTSYYVSGSYMSADGTAPNSSLERYSFRSNADINANRWLKVGANLMLSFDKRSLAETTSNSVYNAAFMSLLSLPYETPYDENGNERHIINGYPNPNYMIQTHPSDGKNLRINGSAYVQINPVKNLNIKSQLGVDGYAYWSQAFGLASYERSLYNGTVSRAHQNGATITSTTTIDYNFDFGNPDHQLYLLAGQEGIRSNALTFTAARGGQINDALMMLSTGTGTSSVSDSASSSIFCSWFGRAEYSYAGKYTFDASVRRDASSRFGAKNRAGIFYSFGALWNLKKERFLINNDVISNLNFKVSYGTQGNAGISDFAHYSHLATTTYGDVVGLYNASRGNEELGWETQKLFTVGVNIEFLKRIRLEASFYNRKTDDLLMDVPEPSTSGYLSTPRNVAAMVNRGIDLTLNVDIFQNKDWYVNFSATFNYNKNEIKRLFNGLDEYVISSAGVRYAVGENAFDLYMQKYAGVDSETGAPQWEVIDADGNRSVTNDFNNATLQMLDKPWMAPLTGGFGVNARWKGISLGADFVWNYGKYLINNALIFLEDPSYAGTFNRSKRLLHMWRQPGDVTDIPAYGYATQFDSSIVEDASFLRLKNLTIAYDFPKKLIARSGFLSGVKVYFTSRNLFTLTGYSGYDPEVDSNLALGNYPNSRQFVGGVQFTF